MEGHTLNDSLLMPTQSKSNRGAISAQWGEERNTTRPHIPLVTPQHTPMSQAISPSLPWAHPCPDGPLPPRQAPFSHRQSSFPPGRLPSLLKQAHQPQRGHTQVGHPSPGRSPTILRQVPFPPSGRTPNPGRPPGRPPSPGTPPTILQAGPLSFQGGPFPLRQALLFR